MARSRIVDTRSGAALLRDRVRTTQDEELAVASDAPLRSPRLPSPEQVIELLEGDFAQAGFDVEDVEVDTAARPARIVIVADGDVPPDLDAIAELSRTASERLDAIDGSDPYVLEVTSPGVERPLTAERHFRRAHGRKAELTMSDGSTQTARIGRIADGVVRLVVAGAKPGQFSVREVAFGDIAKAVVQVEFSPPSRRELELAGVSESGKEADA
jgi:ribosome maturation factor RimP